LNGSIMVSDPIAARVEDRLFRHEHILARKLLKDRGILRKIRGEDVDGISGDPLRQINRLVVPVIEDYKERFAEWLMPLRSRSRLRGLAA
jgi:hypothetical protein